MIEMREFSTLKPLLQSSSDLQTSLSLLHKKKRRWEHPKSLQNTFQTLKETTTKPIAILLLIIQSKLLCLSLQVKLSEKKDARNEM